MKHPMNTPQRGFTLIELVVVIVILGILAAFAIPRFINISTEARVSAINGLAGSLRSTSALLHGMSLAKSNPATLSLEGKTITMVNGYPAGTNVNGIGDAMNSLDGFTIDDTTTAGTIVFSPVSLGTTVVAACSVSYAQPAAANTPPTISVNVTAC